MWSAIVGFITWLIGLIFQKPAIDAAQSAQAEKDRGDVLQSQVTAERQADEIRQDVSSDLARHPDELRLNDGFKRD